MGWETDLILEKKHRPCLCGICHKQIGTLTPRIKIIVSNDSWRGANDYSKFFHVCCLINKIKKEVNKLCNSLINEEMKNLSELNNILKKLNKVKK